MRLGCLAAFDGTDEDLARLDALAAMGYQYVEALADSLCLEAEPDAFYAVRRAWRRGSLVPEVIGELLGSATVVCGDEVDWRRVERHVALAIDRADEVGARTLVVGGAAARCVPDGYPRDEALDQVRYFLNMAADYAGDLTVVIEPLGCADAACPSGVTETAELIRKVGRPEIRLAVDLGQLSGLAELERLAAAGDLLAHVRVPASTCLDPSAGADLERLLAIVHQARYDGRLSVSLDADRADEDGPAALARLRELLGIKT